MKKQSISYEEELYKALQDPIEAQAYLNAALEDEDPHVFLLALKDVVIARTKISDLAKNTNLNRENLYRMLSRKGNPKMTSIQTVLNEIGFNLSVQPFNK